MKKTNLPEQLENTNQKRSSSKENRLDMVSLIVAIISLIITIYIGYQANKIAIRSQPLDYSVTANEHIGAVITDNGLFTQEGIVFKQEKGIWSGDLSSVFLATVYNDTADIVYVPDKTDEEYGFAHQIENHMIYHILPDQPNKLFFGPLGINLQSVNEKPQAFHLIFKGHNKEYTIYTVVYTLDKHALATLTNTDTGDVAAGFGSFNIYILNENNMYDHMIRQQIANDLNLDKSEDEKFTAADILDMIIAERNLCYDRINEVN